MERLVLLIAVATLSAVHAAIPGAFYWRPRLQLDLAQPAKEHQRQAATAKNVKEGLVVAIDGYRAGTLVLALAAGPAHLHPAEGHLLARPHFYQDVYRWLLRHLSLYPTWLGNEDNNYMSAHRVWEKRFHYQTSKLPPFLKKFIPWISDDDWSREKEHDLLYNYYAHNVFRRYQRHPKKKFNKQKPYDSQITNPSAQSTARDFYAHFYAYPERYS